MENNMKKFNLKEALAGKPVVTSQGLPVTQIVHFENINQPYQVFGVVDDHIESWTVLGRFNHKYDNHRNDLFMLSENKSIWVNVYDFSDGVGLSSSYNTEEEALKNIFSTHYIKTIEITNEP